MDSEVILKKYKFFIENEYIGYFFSNRDPVISGTFTGPQKLYLFGASEFCGFFADRVEAEDVP